MSRSAGMRRLSRSPSLVGRCRARLGLLIGPMLLAIAIAGGCRRGPTAQPAQATESGPPPTNRIDVPPAVRKNLGITFAKVERRAVSRTIRAAGRFELRPEAQREYRTMLAGQVELRVAQFDRIEPGQVLYTLDSPAWRELQSRISEAIAKEAQLQARADSVGPLLAAHERHHIELEAGIAVWTERTAQLEQSRTVVTADEFAQARAALATTRADLAEVMEKEAELVARSAEVTAELAAARSRLEWLYADAGSILGMTPERVRDTADESSSPAWRAVSRIEVRAASAGVVEAIALTNGAWAAETSLVLTTIQPDRVRFRARGLQSDLGRLRDGLTGRIAPPRGGSLPQDQVMRGTLRIGLLADPDERTIELLVTPDAPAEWARAGVAGHLEVEVEGAGEAELAMPVAATIRDGLSTLFFRRDVSNPDQVIRLEADLGISDGKWVVLQSGVKEGDEVVLEGIYPLMLASSGSAQKGGHFHADGTYHEGDH